MMDDAEEVARAQAFIERLAERSLAMEGTCMGLLLSSCVRCTTSSFFTFSVPILLFDRAASPSWSTFEDRASPLSKLIALKHTPAIGPKHR
jgi:hypothetical protein